MNRREMPTSICRRCEDITECISIVFVVQHGYDAETPCDLCEDCYNMYRHLYTTRVIEDADWDFEDEEENPCAPDPIEDDIDANPT